MESIFVHRIQGRLFPGSGRMDRDYVDPHTFLQMYEVSDGLNMTYWKNEKYDQSLSMAETSN